MISYIVGILISFIILLLFSRNISSIHITWIDKETITFYVSNKYGYFKYENVNSLSINKNISLPMTIIWSSNVTENRNTKLIISIDGELRYVVNFVTKTTLYIPPIGDMFTKSDNHEWANSKNREPYSSLDLVNGIAGS